MRADIPLAADLVDELMAFWHGIFGDNPDMTSAVLLGEEEAHNRNVLFMERSAGGGPAGTCVLTVSEGLPALGGFGEVATDPALRRSGTASRLCGQAVEEFRAGGGKALFLGTGNGDAARIYHRLGWRMMAGASVMALIADGDSPEAFLVDYFRGAADVAIRPASPRDRIPMIPLIHTPHDWKVLDVNAGMRSTRYAVQGSCMGLYPRYESVTAGGRGAWLSAETADARVVGMATARLKDGGVCRVDGFAHAYHADAWPPLMEAAMSWGEEHGATLLEAVVCVEDEDKRARFEAIGFGAAGAADDLQVGDRTLKAVRLERNLGGP